MKVGGSSSMQLKRLLNPMQWNFGPRTTATLLAWAIIPVVLGALSAWRALTAAADRAGLDPALMESMLQEALRSLLIVTVPLLVICVAAAVYFSWAVVQPLWRLREGMGRIARGDLSHGRLHVHSQDEVGQITGSFNEMATSLQEIVQQMAATATELDGAGHRLEAGAVEATSAVGVSIEIIGQVGATARDQTGKAVSGAKATEELRAAASQLAGAAEAQAREVEQVATTINQVAAAIQQVAAGTGVVSEAAGEARTAADLGGGAVQAVVSGMDQVRDRVIEASHQVEALSDSLAQVDEILQLISDISDQTDLLALNAAIEAARVGEHGRGFAVVADEVRRLADRSRKAASDIGTRVEGLRGGAVQVVNTMHASTREVQRGTELAREAGGALERIREAVAETQRQVESISAASEEISAASAQVVEATHHLSAMAEETAATAEEMLAGSTSVSTLISDVEHGAALNQDATAKMAAASQQVSSTMAEMVASATQVTATAIGLRKHVGRFKLS